MYMQNALFNENRLPRVAYCSEGNGRPTQLRRLSCALKKPQIQINPHTLVFWLIFDVDRPQAAFAWEDTKDTVLPPPSWMTVNPENGHAHLVYGLKNPVCTSDAARTQPLRYLAAVYQALLKALAADENYSRLLTHNPIHKNWHTCWYHSHLYDLAELADYLDLKPITKNEIHQIDLDSNYGRNCALFDHLRFWAYKAIRNFRGENRDLTAWQNAVLTKAGSLNTFPVPLLDKEVKTVAVSVAKWVWRNDAQNYAKFVTHQVNRAKKTKLSTQIKAGRVSGQSRRKANSNKRLSAELLTIEGHTQKQIAEILGITQQTISNWQKKMPYQGK